MASCVLQPNTPPIWPKTHQNPLHHLERSITIAWPKTAPHLDSPSSSYAYLKTPPKFSFFLSQNPSRLPPLAAGRVRSGGRVLFVRPPLPGLSRPATWRRRAPPRRPAPTRPTGSRPALPPPIRARGVPPCPSHLPPPTSRASSPAAAAPRRRAPPPRRQPRPPPSLAPASSFLHARTLPAGPFQLRRTLLQ